MPVPNKSAAQIMILIYRVIHRFGLIRVAVVDNTPKFAELRNMLKDLGITIIESSAYHPQGNSPVENGHWRLLSALVKMSSNDPHWTRWMNRAIFSDRVEVRHSHGTSPFYLIHGWEPILPLEVEIPIWRLVNWDEVSTEEELLEARMRILERKAADVSETRLRVAAFRERLAKKRNEAITHHSLRKTPFQKEDLVLVYYMVRLNDLSNSRKLINRWKGPYRVAATYPKRHSYKLRELNGVLLSRSYQASMLKKFVQKDGWWECDEDEHILGIIGKTGRTKERRASNGEVAPYEPLVTRSRVRPPGGTLPFLNNKDLNFMRTDDGGLAMTFPTDEEMCKGELIASEAGDGEIADAQVLASPNSHPGHGRLEVRLPGMSPEEKKKYRAPTRSNTEIV